jgi:hypothetical protein
VLRYRSLTIYSKRLTMKEVVDYDAKTRLSELLVAI